MSIKQFGAKVTSALEEQYAKSSNWRDGKFQNLEETNMSITFQSLPKLMYKQFFEKKGREPEEDLRIEKINWDRFLASDSFQMIWLGHSAAIMRLGGKTILMDPMLGSNAAPISPFGVDRFSKNTLKLIDEFPEIDLMLLTHDHYDHLDLDSINKLKSRISNSYVALGTARHLKSWGIKGNILEFDWWDSVEFGGIEITFTPSRHFSGRGLTDRSKSLWGGWVMKSKTEKIYWSGDGGYGGHFNEIGHRLGPFDFGVMECGQYNEHWHQIHMYPEESVQAAFDAKVGRAMAVHWGAFALAQHHWKDPIERFVSAAEKSGLEIVHPKLGEVLHPTNHSNEKWWTDLI